MTYGGTNWGHSAAPVVYTSYDYSAGLRETREVRDKLKQMKLLGLFTRVSKDLLKTYMEGNGTGYAVSDSAIWTWALRSPDNGAGFYVFQQDNTRSRSSITFTVNAKTSVGEVAVPNVSLAGRQSKIFVTDYKFGAHTLLYSSAEILVYANLDVDVLVLYLNVGQIGEFAFKNNRTSTFETFGAATDFKATKSNTTTKYTYTQAAGSTVVKFSNGVLVYLLDKATAYNFHAPPTTSNPDVLPSQQIFILGPHLVRTVSVTGNMLLVTGDSTNATSIEAYVGDNRVRTVSWNGKRISTTRTSYGSLVGRVPGPPARDLTLPSLTNWKSADSFPESSPSYDDSNWTICNKTTTLSPVRPFTLPVLFSSDYGYYTGQRIYRATFSSTSNGTSQSLNLITQSGTAAGFSVFLNGQHIYSEPGNATLNQITSLISLPSDLIRPKNYLAFLLDYTGHDQTSTGPSGVSNPRGILGASLVNPSKNFTSWRITGNAGGNRNIDPIRGPMNEGGLYAERLGWHLPGFPTTSWNSSSPVVGISKAGVQFYTTTFRLPVSTSLDVPIGIELLASTGTKARVQVWVNGYLMGKYVPHIGPQTRFPVQPGVLDTSGGRNTIAISIWAMEDAGARLETVRLIKYGVYETGFKTGETGYLRPGWKKGERERFA